MTLEEMRKEALEMIESRINAISKATDWVRLEKRKQRLIGQISMAYNLGIITDDDWDEIYDKREKAESRAEIKILKAEEDRWINH